MFNTILFGQQLSRLRRNADMTQSDLGERVGVTRQAISKYETGDSFPDISILSLLAEALEVTTGELIAAGEPTVGEACILHRLSEGQMPEGKASAADVASLAPLLRPSTVEALAARLAVDGVKIPYLVELSQFLSDGGARRLLAMSDLSDLTPELLKYLLRFMDADSYWAIVDGVLEGRLDWQLLYVMRLDRSLLEAAVIYGVLPEEALQRYHYDGS